MDKAKPMDEQKDHEKKKYLIQDLTHSVLLCVQWEQTDIQA